MKVKIWGARGSTPSPLGPEAVREKIVSAIMNIAKIDSGELREELMAAILEKPDHLLGQPHNTGMYEQVNQKIQQKQRQAVERYVDLLPALQQGTAGGNTPCVQITAGDDLFIIDAGSGIRNLGRELMKGPCGRGEGVIHLLFSHPHWDHIQGFPFFRPAFVPGNQIYIYGVHDMNMALRRQQEFISFPVSLDYMQATLAFQQIEPGEVLNFGDVRIRTIKNQHPGDAYGFRFEKGNKVFVYASDSAYPDGTDLHPYLNFFTDADVLIFDAQFTQRESDEKEDWGHSSSFFGLEMAQEANVKQLVLFHYDPTYSDRELEEILDRTLKFQQNQYPNKIPVEVTVAQEGQVFDLTPPQTTAIEHVPGSHVAILKPAGVFDEHVANELREQLADRAGDDVSAQLIIDMSAVEMLQVAGLRALVKLRKERQDEGASMALVSPSDNVRQLIELAGYLDFFAIYNSVHTAINALEARETLNLPGQMLKNRYQIRSKIGEGRLGTVFRAVDVEQDKAVAIKILSASFSEGAIEQFLRQAREIIDLIHPNVVDVYDCDIDRGIPFMAEEFVEGQTLQVMMDEHPGPLPFDEALSLAGSITRALEYAHAQGVIHGDLKPENVLLGDDAKVSDFGLGRLESGRALINIDVPLALVTARYLAPEQVLGHPIDARTDLYALGVILYELFTGRPPFEGSDREVLELHRSQPPASPRILNPNLSRSLEHLILKLLDKDPTKRYAGARQVGYILSSMSGTTSGEIFGKSITIERWPAMVGREELLQQLAELWLKTEQNTGQVIFIRGEPGVGKTRLVQELIHRLNEVTVLVGECQKLEKSTAYHPFVSALTTYFNIVPPEVAAQSVGQVCRRMASLIPELRGIMPHVLDLIDSDSQQQAAAGLAQTMGPVTIGRPWLIVLDNLQWADQASLRLLEYLAAHGAHMGLMMIGLYDEDELEANEFLADTVERLLHQDNVTLFEPDPLTEAEMRALLESVWSQSAPNEWVKIIYKHTQGNPLYAEELVKYLVEEGIVNRRNNKWYFGQITPDQLPYGLEQVMQHRFRRLSRETQTFLSQIAVLGPVIEFEDLQEMSDLSDWDALESLDTALQRQLLREAPGEKLVRFNHHKMQQVLYNGLSSLKRRLMHREAGEALERRNVPTPKKDVESLAYHFIQAGELEKGLVYAIQAASRARFVYAHQNALYWYTQSLDVMDQLGLEHVTRNQRFDLLLARQQIYSHQGNRPSQAADLQALHQLAQELNDPARQAQAHTYQSAYEYGTGRLSDALTEAQAGLIAARQADDTALESHGLLQLGLIAMHQGHFDTAGEHLRAAQKTFRAVGDPQAEAGCLNLLGTLDKRLNHFDQSETAFRQALLLYEQANDRYGQAACLSNLGDLYRQNGDFTRSIALQNQALVICQITDDIQGQANGLNRLAAVYKELGRFKEARTYVEQAMTLHHTIEDEQGLAEALQILGAVCRAIGDFKSAHDHVGQALEISQRSKNKVQEGYIWLELGLSLEGVGDYVKAGQAYEQAHTLQLELGVDAGTIDARAGLSRCLLAEGSIDAARKEIEGVLEKWDQTDMLRIRYPARLYLTAYQVLEAVGNPEAALNMLQQGQATLQKQAETINDIHLRASFLENVPENKELLMQSEQHPVEEITS